MTLERSFEIFRNNLYFDPGLLQQVTERRGRLIGLLQSAWSPAKILPIGSWARGTAVPQLKDIDLMVVLNGLTPEQRTPSVILGDFESKLRVGYQAISMRKQSRSIGLRFEDFAFDVVPALAKPSNGYHIPDLDDPRRWIFTNPEKHLELAVEADRRCGAMAIPLVKMLKVWNVNNTAGLKSFHLEVMVLRALKQQQPSYAAGAQLVFESLARDVKDPCGDPGGSDNRLDTYLQANRSAVVQKLEDAARRMKEANRIQSQELTRSIFGGPFP